MSCGVFLKKVSSIQNYPMAIVVVAVLSVIRFSKRLGADDTESLHLPHLVVLWRLFSFLSNSNPDCRRYQFTLQLLFRGCINISLTEILFVFFLMEPSTIFFRHYKIARARIFARFKCDRSFWSNCLANFI